MRSQEGVTIARPVKSSCISEVNHDLIGVGRERVLWCERQCSVSGDDIMGGARLPSDNVGRGSSTDLSTHSLIAEFLKHLHRTER